MTSITNENKENVVQEPPKREGETTTTLMVMADHHGRRTALGEQKKNVIAGNPGVMVKPAGVHKRPLDSNKENQPSSAPVVPVAQFEAFKVYEDNYEERMARMEEQLKQKIRPGDFFQVYKGTAEDRFYTKSEVIAMERKRREEEYARFLRSQGSPVNMDNGDEENAGSTTAEEELLLRGPRSVDESLFEVREYREDIYKYLRSHELRHRPKPGYMKKQPDVTSSMRSILVDWLVEVAEEYTLQTETLYLAVNYIDRFLSYMSVVRAKLQLVGTSALFLASKYEEITPPSIADFVYITDDTYTKKQVIRMEHLILKVLNFDLSIPTPLTFIRAMCSETNQTDRVKNLAMYLSELCLLNSDEYIEFIPSVLAASSIAVARHNLNLDSWNEELIQMTGFELMELKGGIQLINYMFKMAPTMAQQAIREKYKAKKYLKVSQLEQREEPVSFIF